MYYYFQNGGEHVGEIFQDQDNMAAILIRRQLENGDLLMVSGQNKMNSLNNLFEGLSLNCSIFYC